MAERESRQVMVVVGCGGIIWHSLPQMANFIHRRGDLKHIILIDPDTTEERNGARQWTRPDVTKVSLCYDLLEVPTDCTVDYFQAGLGNEATQMALRNTAILTLSMNPEIVWIVATPDNYLARRHAWDLGIRLRREELTVHAAQAGNTKGSGCASIMTVTHETVRGDWLKYHPEIAEGAKAEEEGRDQPLPCEGLVNPDDLQDAPGNVMTAFCLWRGMEKAAVEDWTGDVCWTIDKHGRYVSYVVDRDLPEKAISEEDNALQMLEG